MAGDYLFPKRLFKNGEPLDPDELAAARAELEGAP